MKDDETTTAVPSVVKQVNQPGPVMVQPSTSEAFALALQEEAKKRDLLEAFIKKDLKEGVDYGQIPFHRRDCKEANKGMDATCNCRRSKPTMLQPGSQKIANRLQLATTFELDTQLIEALGGNGIVAFVCRLLHHGEVVAEGRGACDPNEHIGQDPNSRVKIAQKRAMVDAVLRAAALSDHFTQDLEDMDPKGSGSHGGEAVGARGTDKRASGSRSGSGPSASRTPTPPRKPRSEPTTSPQLISEKQVGLLWVRAWSRAQSLVAVNEEGAPDEAQARDVAQSLLRSVLKRFKYETRKEVAVRDFDAMLVAIEKWEFPDGDGGAPECLA
jgi:hypothetical protein